MAKNRSIIIKGKEYTMPKVSVDAYMDYLEIRESIMDTENGNGLYTRKQFVQMMETICMLYGNQFTVEDLKDEEGGLSVGEIIMEFGSVELGFKNEIDSKVAKIQKNFQKGK